MSEGQRTTAWTGFGDYMESMGSKVSGKGNSANFEAMLEAALAGEAAEACGPSMDRGVVKEEVHPLPYQFEPLEILTCSDNDGLFNKSLLVDKAPPPEKRERRRYRLTCGLLIHVRHANLRLISRSIFLGNSIPEREAAANSIYFRQITNLCCREDAGILEAYSKPETLLLDTAVELVAKRIPLPKKLEKLLESQPLPLRDDTTGLLRFEPSFIAALDEYFRGIEKTSTREDENGNGGEDQICRPATKLPPIPGMEPLMALGREACPGCGHLRILYCPLEGCRGKRTPNAAQILPPRIKRAEMPFDILMLLHSQETWNRSTGAHAMAMLEEGIMEVEHWPPTAASQKDRQNLLEKLDLEMDILLFPGPSAIPISESDLWSNLGTGEVTREGLLEGKKPRLVVLEANWSYAKGMAKYLQTHLPLLRAVCLGDVTGTYWRFQEEGSSALSTIEALYHAAVQASSTPGTGTTNVEEKQEEVTQGNLHNLLLLFEYQRKRMLKWRHEQGKGTPRGLDPAGDGIHDWNPYIGKKLNKV